jgi:hypothetical protein
LAAALRRSIIIMMINGPSFAKSNPERLAAWRGAALAYRRCRAEGLGDYESRLAAHAAVAAAWPGCPDPSREASEAIAYAAREHTEWFWRPLRKRRSDD